MGDAAPKTLFDKIWASHIVDELDDGTCLLYIDRQLVHEVTSPQAFEGLTLAGRTVRRPDLTLATVDHNIPTTDRKTYKSTKSFVEDPDSRTQCLTLEENVKKFGLTYFGLDDVRQGIVHVIGPEEGFTLPGTTVVCGDSHTSTHGAFGALAFGIGTSEVEHVLATQTLLQKKAKNMRITVNGHLANGVTAKDVALHVIGVIGTSGGVGHVIEFSGTAISDMTMESRMTLCNMAIEAGARAGMIAPDAVTFEYLHGRPLAPKDQEWDQAVAHWAHLVSDPDAIFDTSVTIEANDVSPCVTWGTSPQDVVPITGRVPDPAEVSDPVNRAGMERALSYMGLKPGTPMQEITVDKVFIGSCTNSRIEDLRAAATVVQGRTVAASVKAMVVPGSGLVKKQAEAEGLDGIFKSAGFDWREAGCSMCLGMNPDQLAPGERCASTSNRNFEGRQGAGGRTHLVSPAMAAAAAITGHLTDVRQLKNNRNPSVNVTVASTPVDGKAFLSSTVTLPSPQKLATKDAQNEAETVAVGGMPKFTKLQGLAACLDMNNIDTDMIIPKQFLKTIKRTGLGSALFYSLRYQPDTKEPVADFILNVEPFNNAKILISGKNFGCGSSREHAPWALNDFGIRCIIACSFADIFYNNCFKNGMLPIALPEEQVAALAAEARTGKQLEIDLPSQTVRVESDYCIKFEIEPFRKNCLIEGLDDIGMTLMKANKIDVFEEKRRTQWPWLEGIRYSPAATSANVNKKMDW